MKSGEFLDKFRNLTFASIVLISPVQELPTSPSRSTGPRIAYSCTTDEAKIYCENFQIKKPFPNIKNIYDITPYFRNWRQWEDALTSSWSDGLNYMGSRNCELADNPDDRFYSATRRIVTTTPCLPEIDH